MSQVDLLGAAPGARVPAPASSRDLLCAACGGRDCCSTFGVAPTGRDLRLISESLALPPLAFCRLVATDPGEGFLLDPSQPGAGWRVELLRRVSEEAGEVSAPCLFLLDLPGGFRRCVLADAAPAVCRAFPVAIDPLGNPSLYEGPGCGRRWSPGDLEGESELALAKRVAADYVELGERVRQWNERLCAHGLPASFGELLEFLAGG